MRIHSFLEVFASLFGVVIVFFFWEFSIVSGWRRFLEARVKSRHWTRFNIYCFGIAEKQFEPLKVNPLFIFTHPEHVTGSCISTTLARSCRNTRVHFMIFPTMTFFGVCFGNSKHGSVLHQKGITRWRSSIS